VNGMPHEILHQPRTQLFQLHLKVDAMARRLKPRATPDASVRLSIALKLVTSSSTELQELTF
jgi:hypothetical protein